MSDAASASRHVAVGPRTCGIPIGTKGVPVVFQNSGPAHDAAVIAASAEYDANEQSLLQKGVTTSADKFDQDDAQNVLGALVGNTPAGPLLFVRGTAFLRSKFCGSIGCEIDVYMMVNGAWRSFDSQPLGYVLDNIFLYRAEHGYSELSASPILKSDSVVTEFNPKSGHYEDCDSDLRIPLSAEGGTFVVPVVINDTITLNFSVDSGAADVSIPADVFSTLVRAGTIAQFDITGRQTYTMADGSTQQSVTFNIRSLKIGDKVIYAVAGSVAPAQGMLLLGQSFLQHFKSWSMDNTTHELILGSQQ